jgi:hypothetical protein
MEVHFGHIKEDLISLIGGQVKLILDGMCFKWSTYLCYDWVFILSFV